MHRRSFSAGRPRRWRRLTAALLAFAVALGSPGLALAETAPQTESGAWPQMVPPPTTVTPRLGYWAPSASTHILITDDALAGEGARLAEELAALGLTDAAPEVAYLADASLATEADIVLGLDDASLLTVDGSVTVTAPDTAGVFHVTRALLQQLVAAGDIANGDYEFTFPAEQIRAAHIDIARKHYPIERLEALVRQLSWFGFTELELHFSENEGFAIESTTHPDIASPDAHSQNEIRELIAYANDLHIRVAPSLDMPGHLDHALDAYPELRLHDAYGGNVFGALDITSDAGVEFAHDLIGEYTELFEQPDMPGPVPWNLGGDEFVDFAETAEVQALTQSAQAKFGAQATAYDALTDFVNTTAALLSDAGYQPRVWSDGMLRSHSVALDTSVQVAYWTQRPPGAVPASDFAAAGYELVNVNDEFLYFVLGERVGYAYPTGEAILAGWDDTVYPSVQGSPDLVEASSGGMFAIWSDIPDALTPDALVERVRAPLAAMSVKFADPASTLSFPDLTSLLDDIGAPPEVAQVKAPDALATIAPTPTATPRPSPSTVPAAEGEPGGSVIVFVLTSVGVLVLLSVVLVLLTRRRSPVPAPSRRSPPQM